METVAGGSLDPAAIGFRRLRLDDLPLLHRWLNNEGVARWWNERLSYDAVVAHYTPPISGTEPTDPYLILYGDEPIGYLQTYRVADYPEHQRRFGADSTTAGLDLFIGADAWRHRGLGAPILTRFLREVVFARPDVTGCLIDPDPANAVAIRAYEKAGFRHQRTLPGDGTAPPAYLMYLARPEGT